MRYLKALLIPLFIVLSATPCYADVGSELLFCLIPLLAGILISLSIVFGSVKGIARLSKEKISNNKALSIAVSITVAWVAILFFLLRS